MSEQEISEGEVIKFLGYTAENEDERPENWQALTEGETYTVVGVLPADDENPDPAYLVEAPNPNFDSSKRASKKSNPKRVSIDVFADEVELVEEEGSEEEQEAPAPKAKRGAKRGTSKAKAKAPAAEEGEEEQEEDSGKQKRAATAQDPDLKNLIMLNDEEEDPEIVELVNGTDDIVGLLRELSEEQANAEWRLGGVLYHARVSKDYADDERYAGKGGFALWCEEVLSLEYRKAMYLCNIYSSFRRHGLGAEDLNEMGWGKATKILSLMDEVEDTTGLVSAAKEQTSAELGETIKATRSSITTGGEKVTVRRVQMKFSLVEEQGYLVKELFEMAREQEGETDDNLLFEKIVTEWADDHLGVSDMSSVKRKATRRLNADRKERGEEPVSKSRAKAKTPAKGEPATPAKKAPAKKAPAKKAPAKSKAKVRRTSAAK